MLGQSQECSIHTGRMEIAICLNKTCFKKNNCCTVCLQEMHKDCPTEFILAFKELPNDLIIENQTENLNIGENLTKFVEERKAYFIGLFDRLIADVKQTYNPVQHQDLLNPSTLETLKKTSNIKFNRDSNKVVIEPLTGINKWETADYIKEFKNNLGQNDLFGYKRFKIMSEIWKSHWSMDIDISSDITGTCITKSQPSWNNDDFISKSGALVNHCKYKITVRQAVEYKRGFFIGVVNQKDLDVISEKFYFYYFQEPSNEELEFNGFSGFDTCNMQGTFNSSDLTVGKSFYLEFIPDQMVKIYNDSNTLNVKGDLKSYDQKYNLFLQLGEDPVSIFIERVF